MSKSKVADATSKIVELIDPFSPDERQRIVRAALTLLGDPLVAANQSAARDNPSGQAAGKEEVHKLTLNPRARTWMKQNAISDDEIEELFHVADGVAEFIGSDLPGKNSKEKTLIMYIMAGVAGLLSTGEPKFDDKSARQFCKSAGCFSSGNHSTYLSGRGNNFTGSKSTGWTLTAPGLKYAAAIIKKTAKSE